MQDDLKKIYEAVSPKLDVGDYDSFTSKMQTPEQRKSFYDVVAKNGFDLGDYNAYEDRLKKKDEAFGESSGTSSVTQSASQSEPTSGFRTAFEKGQQVERKGSEVETMDMGTGQDVPEVVPDAINADYINAPWSELPQEEQSVFVNVEKHYSNKGWPSPYAKVSEYKDKEAKIASSLQAGEITEGEYASSVAALASDMGLNVQDGTVAVSEKEMGMYNELVDRYYRDGLTERATKEKDGLAKDVLDALNVGSARVLGLPTRVMALSENISGRMLGLMNLQDQGSPEYFQERAAVESEIVANMSASNKRYDKTITEALATGDMGTAVGQTLLQGAETLPQLSMLIMGNMANATNLALGYMGADKGIENFLENEKNTDMGFLTNVMNSMGVAASEVMWEGIGTVKILNSTKKAIARQGAEVVRDQALKTYTPFFQRQLGILDKGMSAAVREGGTEMATQLTDNIMDRASGIDVPIGEGVIDAGIVGAFIGHGLVTPQMIQANKGPSEYVKRVLSVVPEDMDFDKKVQLIEAVIKGDELNHQIKNGPEATRDALKEELEAVKVETNDLLGKPAVEDAQEGKEGVSPEKGTEAPLEGEKPSEPPKTKIEEVKEKSAEYDNRTLELLNEFEQAGESGNYAEAVANIDVKIAELSKEGKHAEAEKLQVLLEEVDNNKYFKKQGDVKLETTQAIKDEIESKQELKTEQDGLQEQTKAEETETKTEEVEPPPIAMAVENNYGPPEDGPPPDEGIPFPQDEEGAEAPPDAVTKLKKRREVRKKDIKDKSISFGKRMKNILDEHILDVNKKAKDKIIKIGKEAPEAARRLVNRIITQKGATGQSKVDLENASRRVFGDGLNTMSENQQDFLGEVLSLTRTVEIENYLEKQADLDDELRTMLHEGDITKEDAEELLEKIWAKDPDVLAQFKLKDFDVDRLQRARTEYYSVMEEQLKKQYENGLINKGLYEELLDRYPYYSPRMVLHHMNEMDPDGSISGVRPLEGGSVASAMIDPYTLMAHVIQRTNGVIARNRTVKETSIFAKAAPNQYIINAPYAESFTDKMEAKEEGDDFIEPAFKEPPHNMEAVDFLDKGQRKQVWIDKDLWKYIEYESPGEKYAEAMTAVSWLTGTPLLKLAATGANPEFAIKNLPIDALHAWMVSGVYSTFMPQALNQLRHDYAKVAKDAWNKTGRYNEYAEEGGLMDFLTTQGKTPMKFGKHNKKTATLKIIGDSMAKLGEFSEVWTRLAIRERSIDNAKKKLGREPTPEELTEIKRDATAAARDYLDFSQGGNVTKVIDKFVPYLNAGVQVTRGSLRAAAKDKMAFGLKLAQITGLATSLTIWNMGHGGDDEEKDARRNAYLNDISPGIKARNFILMTNFKYTDKGGNQKHLYFKIPKDALQSSITALAEDIYIKRTHDKKIKIMDDKMFKAFQNEMRNITDIGNLPPAYRAYVGSKSNYDEFYERELWTGLEMPKGNRSEEYYPGVTPDRFVRFGEITGRSPVRTQFIMKQFLTESNIFVSTIGEVLDGWTVGMEENVTNIMEKTGAEKWAGTPFIRRILKSTYPQSMGEFEEMQQLDNIQKTANNHALDKFWMETDDPSNDDGFNEFLEEIAEEYGQYEAERMISRATQKMIKDGVSSSMIKLKWLSPEVRGRAFHMLLQEFPDKTDQLWSEAKQLKIDSERFLQEVGRLTDEQTPNE